MTPVKVKMGLRPRRCLPEKPLQTLQGHTYKDVWVVLLVIKTFHVVSENGKRLKYSLFCVPINLVRILGDSYHPISQMRKPNPRDTAYFARAE